MKTNKLNIDFFEEGIKDGPFKVPANYFDDLSESIINKTTLQQSKFWISKAGVLKIAAVFVVAIFVSTLVYREVAFKKSPVDNYYTKKTSNEQPNSLNPDETSTNNPGNNIANVESVRVADTVPSEVVLKKGGKNIGSNYRDAIIVDKPIATNQRLINIDKSNPYLHDTNINPVNTFSQGQIVPPGGGNETQSGSGVARTTNQSDVLNIISKVIDTCSSSSIVLKPLGGSQKHPELKYLWSNGKTTQNISVDKSGVYGVTILKNDEKIPFANIEFRVNILPPPVITLDPDMVICSFESVLLKSGVPENIGYSFKWSNSEKNESNIFLSNLSPGIHEVELTIEGCAGDLYSKKALVTVNDCKLQIANVITPNGDGKNDKFVIQGIENYPNSTLLIMDRNGKLIYENHNYSNDWGGDQNEEGTYYYLLKLKDGKDTQKAGFLTIIKK